MKTTLYKNVDLVQIPIYEGVDEYYLPQNVSWAKEKVDKIVLCTPQNACVSPIDGVTPVLQRSSLQDLYMSIFTTEDREIMHDTYCSELLHTNNYPITIGAKLNLSVCRLFFRTAPKADACILMYVFYGSKEVEDYEPAKESVTVRFPLAANAQITFQEIINTYIHALPAKVRAISCWGAEQNPAYLTLRDHQLTYILRDVHSELCRPQMVGESAEKTQVHPFYVDNIDIDFDYSFIRNATSSANIQTLTFEF